MIEAHLYALHDCMWMVLEDGPLKMQMENPERNPATPDVVQYIPKPKEKWDDRNCKKHNLDNVAKAAIFKTFDPITYSKIKHLKTAMEIWQGLGKLCEGSEDLRKQKIEVLLEKFKSVKMLPKESFDMLDETFHKILNDLASLNHVLSPKEKNVRLLRSLPTEWYTKATAMEEGRNMENYTVKGLLDELRTYEHELKKKKEEQVTPFPTTLMTTPRVPLSEGTCTSNCDTPSSSQPSSSKMENYDEEFAMMVKQFRKFKKFFKKADSVRRPSKGKPQVSDSPPESYLFYNCRKLGQWNSSWDEEALVCMERRVEKSNHEDRWTMSEDDTLCLMAKDDADQEVKSLNKELGILKSKEAVDKLLKATKQKGREGLGLDPSSSKRKGRTTFIPPKPTAKPNKQKGKEKEKPTEVLEKKAAKYPGVWYLDSGCSRHMTGDASLLSNLIPYDGPRVTFGGSNDFGLTKGLGNLVYKGLTIEAVSYVEGLNYNLLSISQFCDKGYSLEFCKDMASLKNISRNEVILTGKRIRNIYEVIWDDVKEACLISKDKDDEVKEGERMKPTEFIPFGSLPLKTSQRNPDSDNAELTGNHGQPFNIPDLSQGDNSGNGDPVPIHPETPTTSILQPEAELDQLVNPNQHNLRWLKDHPPQQMEYFIQSIDFDLWLNVLHGPFVPRNGDFAGLSSEDKKKLSMNAKAMNILHCSLGPDEFARVCSCKTAKEVWDLHQATHEGDTSTKQTMLALGNSEYESFKIGQHESIQDANRRFNEIINKLEDPKRTNAFKASKDESSDDSSDSNDESSETDETSEDSNSSSDEEDEERVMRKKYNSLLQWKFFEDSRRRKSKDKEVYSKPKKERHKPR
ncbi:unnamed protein product [Cuscuta campestris]|uniref:Retrovirus-related Pol polyprotein from transposon TNT 1-94-like beta-barrel domain-containing protein n=1 Tax=Cuscuta campestris TaxID=132261 RepID=A0A484MAY8_9ASTE|nr:unnamed protein product [Cuscuta campestris]